VEIGCTAGNSLSSKNCMLTSESFTEASEWNSFYSWNGLSEIKGKRELILKALEVGASCMFRFTYFGEFV
jgi:hypothetical protein